MNLTNIVSLALEITSYCNLKCPQCSRISLDGKFASSYLQLKHWDTTKILPNLEISKLENLRLVRLEGDNGDAIMHPNIEEIISFFYNARSDIDIVIFTNGSLRNKEWWYQLGLKFKDRLIVQFSIDGLEDTNSIYRLGSDYNKIIENAAAFLAAGGTATTRAIIFKHNEHQIEQIYNKAKEVGFKQLVMILNDFDRFFEDNSFEVFDNGKKLYNIFPTSLEYKDIAKYSYCDHDKQIQIFGFSNNKICPGLRSGELTVTYLGHIIPCCMVNVDYDFKIEKNNYWREIVGDRELVNLHKRKLSEILSDPNCYFNKLEDSLRNGPRYFKCEQYCKHNIENALMAHSSVG